jgi:sugar phosphate isomerase/epimerase
VTDYSYQLYSSRKFGPMPATLKMISRLGYSQCEGYGAMFEGLADLGTLRADLEANGLTMPTGHFGLEMVQTQGPRVLEISKALNIKTILVPSIAHDQRVKEAAGWAALGRELAEAGKPFWDAGFGFGWHNHAFEFAEIGAPETPLDLILQGSERLALEFDVAWAVKAGVDPFGIIDKYRSRLRAAHVKDIAPTGVSVDEDGWADVGQGTMDWPALIAALKLAGCTWLVMEHDNPRDDRRFAGCSIAALKAM